MKLKEQLEINRALAQLYRDALKYVVLGRVKWSDFRKVTRIAGMPPTVMQIGLVESSDPFVIVHEPDALEVFVMTPYQVAQWPWPTVSEFPGLAKFLVNNVDKRAPINVHVPGYAWLRRLREVEESPTVLEENERHTSPHVLDGPHPSPRPSQEALRGHVPNGAQRDSARHG
jgi:hypothetical protein